jgi:hypothetical protein
MRSISSASSNPGRRHGTQPNLLPEALLGQLFAVGGGGQRDDRVGVEMIDVRGLERRISSATTGAWLVPVMQNRSSPESCLGM